MSAAILLNAPRGMAQDAATPPAPAPAAAPSAAAAPAVAPVVAPSASPSGRGGWNGTDFRQRMNEFIKTALKVNDDEWAVIQPLLEKVQTLERDSMMGRFGAFAGMGGGGGRRQRQDTTGGGQTATGGGAAAGSNRSGSPEIQALKAALDSDSTSTEDIKAKLQALRDARKKSAAELEQARADLEKVLTLRQEATLVDMGILQ